ncbi:MAG: M42 family peptidase [Chloroflexi bacterium]|nr:M42 family peptidase [Chloroflexota bacterium]
MNEMTSFLLSLLSIPGISGYEKPVSDLIAEKWRPLVDELTSSRVGSLHGLRRTASKESRPSLMIATHMDAIGLMVRKIEKGFLLITPIGGIDPSVLPAQLVTVHGKRDLPGIVQLIPNRLLDDRESAKAPAFKTLFIDTGLSEREIKRLVQVGDRVSFAQIPFEMSGGIIGGHSIDNRASVVALTACLAELKNYNLEWNLIAAATVQEETTMAGAYTSAYELRPNLAVTLDVTFAKGPGSTDFRTFPLGKGPTIGLGANIHPILAKQFISLAEELDMPYSIETMPRSSGTDSMAIQITAEGIPNEVLSIPIRYMHTPVELVAMSDIFRTSRLLAKFITRLSVDYLNAFNEDKTS